jgi:uncharacterized protein
VTVPSVLPTVWRCVSRKGDKEAATTATTSTPATAARPFPLMYFVLVFAFTWALWWLAVLDARGLISLPIPALALGAFGPMVAAVVVTAQESGRAGLRTLLGRVVR